MNKLYWVYDAAGFRDGCWLQTAPGSNATGEKVIARLERGKVKGSYCLFVFVSSSEYMGDWESDRTKYAGLEDSLTGLDMDAAKSVVEAWCRMFLPIKYQKD